MIFYYILFAIPLFLFLSQREILKSKFTDYWLLAIITIFTFGLRTDTGGDWWNYYNDFQKVVDQNYFELFGNDPQKIIEFLHVSTFWILSTLSAEYGYYIYHILAMLIGLFALYTFAKEQPYFWLTITISIHLFLIILIMGYTRQGIAISILMISLSYLTRQKITHFISLVIIAASFHASAIVMTLLAVPFIIKENSRNKTLIIGITFVLAIAGADFLQNYIDKKSQHYITESMSSAGALPRLLITAFAGFFFFLYKDKWKLVFNDYELWRLYAILSFLPLPLLSIIPSTTVDRFAFYLLPLQLAVWPRIIYLSSQTERKLLTLGILGGYSITLYVWLNYAHNVEMWVPFEHLLFTE